VHHRADTTLRRVPIDFGTGVVVFDDGTTLRPFMPRDEVPDDRDRAVDGTVFRCWWTLKDGALTAVHLMDATVAPYDLEDARRKHDAWLRERLGEGSPWNAHAYPYGGVEYRFRWGHAGSYAIPQDLNTFIGLYYE
jgi:hypothetical protein